MTTKKVYDNIEDFDEALRVNKCSEVLYNYTVKSEPAQERREFNGADKSGNKTTDSLVIAGQRVFYIVSFASKIDENNMIYHYETTTPSFISTGGEASELEETVKTTMLELMKAMKQKHPSIETRKGTLLIEK